MEDEIREEFCKSGFRIEDEEEVLRKCHTFCINYNIKASELVSSWEVYYLNRINYCFPIAFGCRQLDESTVQDAEMDGFLLHLQNEQKEAIIKEEPGLHLYSSKDVDMILNQEDEDNQEAFLGTTPEKSEKPYKDQFDSARKTNENGYSSSKLSKLVTPFGQRREKFVMKLNIDNLPHVENGSAMLDTNSLEDDIIKKVQPQRRCSLVVHESGLRPGCRFMYDRIEGRFNAVENRIKKHSTAFVNSGRYEEQVDPSVASQKSIFCVGMICCDGEGHINDKSILMQSSVEHSGGQCVRLELQKLSQFSIFPGQIVGIQGKNPSGHCLIASEIIDNAPFPICCDTDMPPAKKQTLSEEIQSNSASTDISAIIAAGPFSTCDNLSFEPLNELLAYARRKQPQLLILLGPFVDSEHPQIRKGVVDVSFEELFDLEVLKRLQDYVEYMGDEARVVVVPSIRDASHDFVFPQPAFGISPHGLRYQITSISNPGIFQANQVKMACCTVDVLKHLSAEEMSRFPAGMANDRLGRLANHILNQRSFYPLYPPSEALPMDFSLAPEALHIPSIPDIMILPSDIKYFIKVLSVSEGEGTAKCVCINPGRLAKGEGGGTFVELRYNGSPDRMHASVMSI